jgi:hypothetical protein
MMLVCSVAFGVLLSSKVAFSAAEYSGASLFLTWNPSPSTNLAGYVLYYGVDSGQYTSSLDAGTGTMMTVSGLSPGQTYYFAVAAYDYSGVLSPCSNEATNTAPLLTPAQPARPPMAVAMTAGLSSNDVPESPVKAGGNVSGQTAVNNDMDLTAAPSLSTPAVAPGNYNGLFYQTDDAGVPRLTEDSTGFLWNCTVETNGAYSSRIRVEGQPFTCSGMVNAAGGITARVDRSYAGLSDLSLTLYADAASGTARLAGTVSNMDQANPWAASLSASLQTNAFSPAADFFFLSPPPVGHSAGSWTCQLSIASNGAVVMSGQLGDGAPIWQSGFVGADGSFPVYQSLYNDTGLLAGWIAFSGGAPAGNLTWIQPAAVAPFTQGYTNIISFGSGPGSSTNCFQLIQYSGLPSGSFQPPQ